MITFAERWRGRARSLAAFGDSITQALHIEPPEQRWANRLAALLGIETLCNRGLSGTVMQASRAAGGAPRAENGRSRYQRDLLADPRADLIAILYGSNDARYTASPETFHRDSFVRDYREVLAGLFDAGYAPDAVVIGSPPHLPDVGFAVGAEDGFAGQTRAAFQGYVTAVRDIARTAGTYYAPVNERTAAEGGDDLILPDHVHPNPAGHTVIAQAFADATRLENTP